MPLEDDRDVFIVERGNKLPRYRFFDLSKKEEEKSSSCY